MRPTMAHTHVTGRLASLALLALGALGFFALPSVAAAAEPAPHLELEVAPAPTNFSPADTGICEAQEVGRGCDQLRVTAYSSGSLSTHGQIVLTDHLPAGLQLLSGEVELIRLTPGGNEEALYKPGFIASTICKVSGQTVTCKVVGSLAPDQALQLRLPVLTMPSAVSGELDIASVSGGESSPATLETPITIGAPPSFGLSSLLTLLSGPAGEPLTQAGAHPFEFTTRFRPQTFLGLGPESVVFPTATEDLRDAVVELPPGLIGSALAAPRCAQIDLTTLAGCPSASRVGFIRTEPNSLAQVNSPIYNMVPEHGIAAEFGFIDLIDNPHFIYAGVVPGLRGYVIRATTPETPQIALSNVIATFFGDPSTRDNVEAVPPMFSLPADCSGEPLSTRLSIDSWQHPGPQGGEGPVLSDPRWASASAQMPAVTGCEELRFDPSLEASVENTKADSPTGFGLTLKVPQSAGAEELATPPLRKAIITLPAGLAVNPSSANGLGACSLTQVGISPSGQPDGAEPSCPDDSKIGTLELESPALPGILQGQIYLARQGENPFGTLLAIYLVVDDPTTGVLVKLAGEVRPDPVTGQLTTVVDQSPQLPFSELRTHFFAGNRAALRTPATCGSFQVTSQLTPWSAPQSGPPATPSATVSVSQPPGAGACPTSPAAEPNHPAFSAGTLSPLAGAYSPFVLRGERADGDQPITAVNVKLPPGLLGRLAGVPYCPEAAIALAHSREHLGGGAQELASPSCPAASEVGVVQVGAGAGPEPYYVSGHAYLTGPYKGAPLGLVIVSPALAGPFDLGDVVVRAALQVDPFTTQISAVSDPIPTIVHGIGLDVRSIALEMNRPDFTLNPTNCEKTAITGEALGQFGTNAAVSEPFQVTGCDKLGFKPKLRINLKGSTKRSKFPALKATLTYPKGSYANVAKASVALPHSEFLAQEHIKTICTRVQFAAGSGNGAECPKGSIYGKARASSPLLDTPLSGPVYLRSSSNPLPDLVIALRGQIDVALVGRIDSKNGGIRTTFESVPDAPVSKFVLEMQGGKKGLLVNSTNLCAHTNRAISEFTGQNGKLHNTNPVLSAKCSGKKGKGHKGGKAHR